MCDCLKKIEASMYEHTQKMNGEVSAGRIIQSQFPFSIKGGIKARTTYSEYEYKFAPLKKDGSIGKPKTQSINLGHNNCPFCGEKYEKDAE